LLTHSSGFKDINKIEGYKDSILQNPTRILKPEELLYWVQKPEFEPGKGWNYSNTNYILLGMILEKASGKSYADYLKENILDSLKLKDSYYPIYQEITKEIAQPWQNKKNISAISRNSLHSTSGPAGAIYSTASDMADWYLALFSNKVLSEESMKELRNFQGPNNYSMGLSNQQLGKFSVWGHTGSIRGYQSCFLYEPTSGIIVCVLCNSNPSPAARVAAALLNTSLK
jgi:CubicO group peptidase (beta-lactamase class C family)